jgi:hypothetical protein
MPSTNFHLLRLFGKLVQKKGWDPGRNGLSWLAVSTWWFRELFKEVFAGGGPGGGRRSQAQMQLKWQTEASLVYTKISCLELIWTKLAALFVRLFNRTPIWRPFFFTHGPCFREKVKAYDCAHRISMNWKRAVLVSLPFSNSCVQSVTSPIQHAVNRVPRTSTLSCLFICRSSCRPNCQREIEGWEWPV